MIRAAAAVLSLWLAALPLPSAAAELVFAKVQVNGTEGVFLVDTGAPVSLLSSAFAARAGLKLGEPQVIRGGGGDQPARTADNVAVRAEGGPQLTLDPPVSDLAAIGRAFGGQFDGILGGDYFGRLTVVFDYKAGTARFAAPDARARAGGAPLKIVSTPYVEAVAEQGGRRVRAGFQIDTGSNTAVEFWAPFSRRAFPEVKGQPSTGIGVAGETRSRLAPLDALEIGERRITGLIANFADTLRPDDAPRDYGGVIGGPAFKDKVVTIDYLHERMWVE